MNRRNGIIIALSLTGLVLITILALGFGRAKAQSSDGTGVPPVAPQLPAGGQEDGDVRQELKAWQAYSRQLEQTVLIMQDRETQYQQELDAANQTIGQLQDELNSGNRLGTRFFSGEHDEHEEHEFGEFDD
ncbi:MAG: hypothetical protein PVH18_11955 [Chloroflexota bacterium]|jgi:hypothetical protein